MQGLGHRFGDGPWLFRNASLQLLPDRVYGLIGPSGSGKSTMMSLLAGWVTPVEGVVSRKNIARTSWVFQNPSGIARRSVLDHVILPLLARGQDIAAAETSARGLLNDFGLAHLSEQPFRSLSGGEAQRLMLARGVASSPNLLLIDEPTAQLDLQTRRDVNAVIQRLRTPTSIVVIATHDEETRDACTDIIDLREYRSTSELRSGTQ